MGRLHTEFLFDGHAPDLGAIIGALERLSGLSVTTEVLPEEADSPRQINARLAFECAPEEELEIYTYRPGGVKEFCNKMFDDPVLRSMAATVEGMNEPPGKQAVYLTGFVGQELSLFNYATCALETLGGQSREMLLDNERATYQSPMTADELRRRHRKNRWAGRLTCAVLLLSLPLWIPLWVLSLLWTMLALPWSIQKARRRLKDATSS